MSCPGRPTWSLSIWRPPRSLTPRLSPTACGHRRPASPASASACSCSTSPRRWCMPSRQQMCPPWPCPPTSILDGPVAALDVLPSPGGDLVDAGDQLAQVADLEHLVAVGGVGAHDRVGGVPLVPRLGVEPVEVAGPFAQAAEDLQAGVAVIVAGVAHDQEGAAPVEVGAVALLEGGEDVAVVGMAV